MEVDILDNRTWTTSTIIDVREEVIVGKKYKILKFGLRFYRPEGKYGEKNNYSKKFFGWSETFDKELSVHSPRLRK